MLSAEELKLKEKVAGFGNWMYKFDFTENVSSKVAMEELLQIHESRKKMIFSRLDKIFANRWNIINCLDIACNEGYYSFEVCKKGAQKVIGFDARKINIEKANFVKDYLGYNSVQFFVDDINTLDHTKLGHFDLVLLLGLIYHVENPMLVLRKARALTKEVCIIDTQITRFNERIAMGWGLGEKTRNTMDSIGIIEEDEYEKNIAASVTGLSFVPNKSAIFTMLRHAGFLNAEIIEPFSDSHGQYTNFDRIIIVAK